MQILNHYQISHKISRIAYEILERRNDDNIIHLVGINNNGFRFASLIHQHLESISNKSIQLSRLHLNPANPLEFPVKTDLDKEEFDGHSIILVDDVANTGRTLFYAFTPFLSALPERIEVAVLVDRKHKLFPVSVDYMGMSLATTVQDNIKAHLTADDDFSVVLE